VGGCGKGDPPQKAKLKEIVAAIHSVTNTMSGVTDSESAEKASEAIKKEAEKVRRLSKEILALGKMTRAQDEKVKDMQAEFGAARSRYEVEEKRMQVIFTEWRPESHQAFAEALLDFINAMNEFGHMCQNIAP
jgi:hypothetical protein